MYNVMQRFGKVCEEVAHLHAGLEAPSCSIKLICANTELLGLNFSVYV